MGETGIPVLDFTEQALDLKEGSEGWKSMCKKVREACEEYGCFQVAYDKVPKHMYGEMLMAMKCLFNVSEEKKKKNTSSKKYAGYSGKTEFLPLYETLTIENANQLHEAKEFTDLMWSQGNPDACRVFNSMAVKLLELHLLIMKMILESFGLGKYYASHIESIHTVFRFTKYDPPSPSHDSTIGLMPHTDKTVATILGQLDEVQGLEVLSKDGDNYIPVQLSQGTFVVFVGDMLKVLTNGRVHAVKHKVEMKGDRERHTYGLFVVYKDEVEVKVPNELVDEDHPPLFRPFHYSDFLRHFFSNFFDDDALMAFAGI